MIYLKYLAIFLFAGLVITSTDTFNPNTCAWGSLGASEPTKPEDCLSDQSDPSSTCCFMEYTNMLPTSGTVKRSCSKQISALVANADAAFNGASASLIIDGLKLQTFTCKTNSTVTPNANNYSTPNTCAWQSLKEKQPSSEDDCYNDKSVSGYSCCYMEYSIAGNSNKLCTRQSTKAYSASAETVKNTMKSVMGNIGANVVNFNCKVSSSGFIFIPLTILFVLGLIL